MPKIDPIDLLTKRDQFPDEMELTLANGDTISVKEYRDRALPKADFTRATEGWAAKERDLTAKLDTASQNLARAIEEKTEAERRGSVVPHPPSAGTITREELAADPVTGLLIKELDEVKAQLTAHQATTQTYKDAFIRDRYLAQLGGIAQHHNSRFKDRPFDQDAFLKYAQTNPVLRFDPATQQNYADLPSTYREWVREDETKLTIAEAEARGLERGKALAKVPPIPSGRRSVPKRDDTDSTSVQNVKIEDVVNDPDLEESFQNMGM